jgi:isopentenyl-diphosphate delta-isomerase
MLTRKIDHIDIFLRKNVKFQAITPGFENYRFMHNALPELDYDKIDMSTEFFGKKLNYPILISPLSGGTELSKSINRKLARLAKEFNIGMSVGSQRPSIDDPNVADTYKVRDLIPDQLLIGNIGAIQLNNGYTEKEIQRCFDLIDADVLCLHLNPLMEIIQPEGNTNFAGLIEKIKDICSKIGKPIIAKEVGNGLSGEVAQKLEKAGVKAIDIAGSGGISWAVIEGFRRKSRIGEVFRDWGIPTTECIIDVRDKVKIPLIASGGIASGIDAAKALALGADMISIGAPLLKPALGSYEDLREFMKGYLQELQISMFCIGADTIERLKSTNALRKVN